VTSVQKLNANRLNGRKSRGPKTAAGKTIASRNALRHGFCATKHGALIPQADVALLAMALCGKSADDPALFRQALIIAETDLLIRAINKHQLAIIERLRDPSALPLSRPDDTLRLMKARVRQDDDARKAIVVLRDALLKKYEGRLPADYPEDYSTEFDALFPAHLEEFLTEQEGEQDTSALGNISLRDGDCARERDEEEAFEMAVKDLVRFDRYERRAASRMRQAIFAFIELKREDGNRAKREAC
jgi:hypothetical protein